MDYSKKGTLILNSLLEDLDMANLPLAERNTVYVPLLVLKGTHHY